jgi:hypothetical protein
MSEKYQFGLNRYLYLPVGGKQALTEFTYAENKGVNNLLWHEDYSAIIDADTSVAVNQSPVGTRAAARNSLEVPTSSSISRTIGFTVRYRPESVPKAGDTYGSWDYFYQTLSYAELYQLEIAVMQLDRPRNEFPSSGWAANCKAKIDHSFALGGLVTLSVELSMYQWYHPIRHNGSHFLFTPAFDYISGYFPPAEVT